MLLPIFTFLALVQSLHIVEDFRVPFPNYSPIKALKTPEHESSFISYTNSIKSLSPTFTLAPDIQMLYTDNSLSIYYMNANISSSSSTSQFPLLLDTGSALSWIYNSSCSVNGCELLTTNKFTSPANLKTSNTFKLSYSGDEVYGEMFSLEKNNLDISFSTENNSYMLKFDNFSLGLTNNSPSMFSNLDISGLIGISAKESSENLVQQLYASNEIDLQVFGIYLESKSQTLKYTNQENNVLSNYGGLILFGEKSIQYLDKFVGNNKFEYAVVVTNPNSYWLIDIDEIRFINSTDTSSISKRQAIIDTGTTGLALPLDDANNIHKLLFGNDFVTDNKGNYAFPCRSTNNITFSINKNLTLDLPANSFKGLEYDITGLEGYCASKIQGIDSDYWILGSTFLSQFYTVFDLENKRIGFGELDLDSYMLSEGNISGSGRTNRNGSGSATNNTNPDHSSTSVTSLASLTSQTSSSLSTTSSNSSKTSSRNSSSVTNPTSIFTSLILIFLALIL